MDRPTTSKARGACRYFMTPRGCFAGDNCKFLHGEEQQLTPFDQSKSCRFYAQGYCRRGDECWFRHIAPEPSTSQQPDNLLDSSAADDVCNICLEKPSTYGLLTGCGHIFCIKCIRQWRDPAGKSGEMSGVIKKCPLCRAPSRYITPSSISFPHDNLEKAEAINKYKASMARVPCRYFQLSKPSKRFCPFGKDCFYQHLNDDGTTYIFPHGTDHYMKLLKYRQNHGADTPENVAYHAAAGTDPLNLLNLVSLLSNNPLADIHATIETLRANWPAVLDQLENGERDEEDVTDGEDEDEMERLQLNSRIDGGYGDADADTLGRLADRMLESLAALRDNALPSPTPTPRSNWNIAHALDDDDDDLPPLELLEPNSLSSESLLSRESPSPALVSSVPSLSPSPSATTAATSRFSTVVGNRSQERIFIDLESEDDDDESEEQGTSQQAEEAKVDSQLGGMGAEEAPAERDAVDRVREDREMIWREYDVMRETSLQQTEGTFERRVHQVIGPQTLSSESINDDDSPTHTPLSQYDHLTEPPFVTDGRGRVVWSSMRSARGGQTGTPRESPTPTPPQTVVTVTGTTTASERRAKARRTGREATTTVADTTASNGFTTDGRGRVIWTGTPVQTNTDGEAASRDNINESESGEVHGESAVTVAATPEEIPRRSFFGRVYDVVFS